MRHRFLAAFVLWVVPVFVTGCDLGVSMSTGLQADLRIRGARFVEEPFPPGADPDAGAPDPDAGADATLAAHIVAVVQSTNLQVSQEQQGKEFNGSVSFNARTVAVGLEHDRGYWLLPVDAQDIDLPPNLTFRAVADFADDLPTGPRSLLFAAVDASGRVGSRRSLPLEVRSSLPDAPLAVVLDWDRNVDLDLIVYLPDGTTLTNRGLRRADGTFERGGMGGPRIDIDSNADCAIDANRREIATFPSPAAGRYEVRVHLFRACGEPKSAWRVRVVRGGTVVSTVNGITCAAEADQPGGRPTEDGRRALVFQVVP